MSPAYHTRLRKLRQQTARAGRFLIYWKKIRFIAAFMLFLVSEVHPFIDGNGRVARIMMNAELVAGGQVKILIPTV